MSTITAIYERGVLRPLTPLSLPEHARVQIQVQQVSTPDDATAHRGRVREVLVAAGLSLPASPSIPTADILSDEQREELALRFSAPRPLSDLIMEERESR